MKQSFFVRSFPEHEFDVYIYIDTLVIKLMNIANRPAMAKK